MHVLFTATLGVLGFMTAGSVLYLLGLLLAAARSRRADSPISEENVSFAVVIPAHDEELVLASTLESLGGQCYPPDRYEVVVVADNCTDATTSIARAHGATVLERSHATERGKGHALQWALTRLLARPRPVDAFVIVDADTRVAPDFLAQMAARLAAQTDARGMAALQGRYGVLNPGEGWRAALMAAAFDLFNHVKPLGRERLGLGVGLKGNGMAFTRALLQAAPWRGDSLTEDIDYALDLARYHGVRVGYVPEAVVRAQMPTTARQAASQRARWEGGRYQLLRERALPLLAEGLRRRSRLLCDAALDLVLPPLAELGALLALWATGIALGARLGLLTHPPAWAAAAGLTALGLLAYVLGGLRVAHAPRAAYLALLCAPCYAGWKFCLYGAGLLRRRRSPAEWVRTARAPLPPSATPASEGETL
ncbi:MAG: glycosyltransferase [Armatimonadetes bacterium]|nr:glycosyltransferase [Armatimonadota bacterium]